MRSVHHNNQPDYVAAAAGGIRGVFYKASQGTLGIDPTFAASEAKECAAELWWGAYHFGTGEDGVAQAEHFLAQVKHPERTLLALDFERKLHGPTMTIAQAHDFVTHVHDRTGQRPGLCSGALVRKALGDRSNPVLANCWFWLAQYGPTPVVPRCWPTWTFWQYSDGADPAPVPGVGHCDRDRFNGDADDLEQLWPR